MCGIAGLLNLTDSSASPEEVLLRRMLAMIRHRGPDEFGIYLDDRVGLGSARLSIIDLSCGQQPIGNEDGTLWIVFNGEIFNYLELRVELEARGHRFATQSDTEVLLHAYEEFGPDCLQRLNGQFAFAVWNSRDRTLFMARDRLGVRPLFYTVQNGRLVFASEIKSILADRRIRAAIDPVVLDQVFTFWCPPGPETVFSAIRELPPGHYLVADAGRLSIHGYWAPEFAASEPAASGLDLDGWVERTNELLVDAARIRLRADVPVGAYLSGGLDSSLIASIIRKHTANRLDTFSIAFDDAQYDESSHQQRMARFLGTEHKVVRASYDEVARVFPEVIWHTEVPLMRTAPAPMFLLSKLVRDSGYKVVLTGEGADEFFAGYDIFKEAKLRRFWARQPASTWRPLLFQRLYPDIAGFSQAGSAMLAAFFKDGLTDTGSAHYSHAVRWRNNRRACRFFSGAVREDISERGARVLERLAFPGEFQRWTPLARAQYLEISIFLSHYLLSSQGDRVAMAHSVEGRFPFLDYRMVELCSRMPDRLKLRAFRDKYLLRRVAAKYLPADISARPKRPYRAPIQRSFFPPAGCDYVRELTSERALQAAGLFEAAPVRQLVAKAQDGRLGESDEMALVGVISTQLLHRRFIESFEVREPVGGKDKVKVVDPRRQYASAQP